VILYWTQLCKHIVMLLEINRKSRWSDPRKSRMRFAIQHEAPHTEEVFRRQTAGGAPVIR
jgi:hypothetical protein